jgi:hypothetical protein
MHAATLSFVIMDWFASAGVRVAAAAAAVPGAVVCGADAESVVGEGTGGTGGKIR